MKKSTIWLLVVVMVITIVGLLYVQIGYMHDMMDMRNEQFSETVMRSMYSVNDALEQDESRYYLDNFLDESERFAIESTGKLPKQDNVSFDDSCVIGSNSLERDFGQSSGRGFDFNRQYENKQSKLKAQYLKQKGLLNEVILSIITEGENRPVEERADSNRVNTYLRHEFANNGLQLPYEYALVNPALGIVYKSAGYVNEEDSSNEYSLPLFHNDSANKQAVLKVTFPTKRSYLFSSVKFMIPSFAFTFILLIIFIYTIYAVLRQKKLSEIKNDFINNMTHEFKTPISSISLAAQMLNDETVQKSPALMNRACTVISDETKRLRFQVEKVLQMSMFDRKKSATLRLEEVDVHATIDSVVSTYKLKVENYGGHIHADFEAEDSIVAVDEMHFTNVIFNLLDNAVKYRRENVPPELHISTRNVGDDKLQIRISDNGIGIKKEDLKKIFEKFYRVHTGNRHDVKGFGLGLAYVHKMITLFDGTIKAESEINKGTTFVITIPLIK